MGQKSGEAKLIGQNSKKSVIIGQSWKNYLKYLFLKKVNKQYIDYCIYVWVINLLAKSFIKFLTYQ